MVWVPHVGHEAKVIKPDEEVGYCLSVATPGFGDLLFCFVHSLVVAEVVVCIPQEVIKGECSIFDFLEVVGVVALSPLIGNSFSEEGEGSDDLVFVFVDLVGVGDDTLPKGFVFGFVTIEY